MKKIKLYGRNSDNDFAIVDDDIILPKGRWNLSNNGYAVKKIGGRQMGMHRFIMQTPEGLDTDHLNGKKLDNRRVNLRICSKSHNYQRKVLQKNNTSGFRGVSWFKPTKQWVSIIGHKGKNICIGYYDNVNLAAKSYNRMAKKLYGKYAALNAY